MDGQILRAKEAASSRKIIMEKVDKWMTACEEECWLEEYDRVSFVYVYAYMVISYLIINWPLYLHLYLT